MISMFDTQKNKTGMAIMVMVKCIFFESAASLFFAFKLAVPSSSLGPATAGARTLMLPKMRSGRGEFEEAKQALQKLFMFPKIEVTRKVKEAQE